MNTTQIVDNSNSQPTGFDYSKSDTSNIQFLQKNIRSNGEDKFKNSFQREWENSESNGFLHQECSRKDCKDNRKKLDYLEKRMALIIA